MDVSGRHRDLVDLDPAFGKKIRGHRIVIIRKNDHALNAGGDQ